MSHMITATGKEYHLTPWAPGSQRPVCIEDIAHQLSLINRFHGATSRPYSVAEHSLVVCQLAAEQGLPPIVQLACLLHDAHEVFTNDLSSPAKSAVDAYSATSTCGVARVWHLFELEHARHVRSHFGLLTIFKAYANTIRHLDLVALATEREYLTAWNRIDNIGWPCLRDGQADAIQPGPRSLTEQFEHLTWRGIAAVFRGTYDDLKAQVTATAELQLQPHTPTGQPGETA